MSAQRPPSTGSPPKESHALPFLHERTNPNSIGQDMQASLQVSLVDVVALCRILTNRKDEISQGDRNVFTAIHDGLSSLINRGLDYHLNTNNFLSFIFRIRQVEYPRRVGPPISDSKDFIEMTGKCREEFQEKSGWSPVRQNAASTPSDLPEHIFMQAISSELVFCNFSRSMKLMNLCLVPTVSSSQDSLINWICSDLLTLNVASTTLLSIESELDFKVQSKKILQTYIECSTSLSQIRRHIPYYMEKRVSLEPHPEGAKVQRNWISIWAARVYVVAVFVGSVLVAVMNLAKRDNIFERVSDAVQFASVFLFSVFGFLKLTSDDPNFIRNCFLGIRVIRTVDDLLDLWNLETEDDVKKVLALVKERQEWLEPNGTCYVVSGTGKGIVLSTGISPLSLYQVGCDFDGNRYYRPGDEKGFHVLYRETGSVHIKNDDYKYIYPLLNFPTNAFHIVSGK